MTDRESTRFLTFGEDQKSREGAIELFETTIASYGSEQPIRLPLKATLGLAGLTLLNPILVPWPPNLGAVRLNIFSVLRIFSICF
ncbi:hypothetical protein [Halomicronema hongdechloris]|nr:hypothetical protein [Halomicronema hongdechloris]